MALTRPTLQRKLAAGISECGIFAALERLYIRAIALLLLLWLLVLLATLTTKQILHAMTEAKVTQCRQKTKFIPVHFTQKLLTEFTKETGRVKFQTCHV
jgi:hypothetical protein